MVAKTKSKEVARRARENAKVVTYKQLDEIFASAREMPGGGDPDLYEEAVQEIDVLKDRLYRELRRLRRLASAVSKLGR